MTTIFVFVYVYIL